MNAFLIKQRRHFTILETLIAMTLLCVFLVMIFGFFRELTTITRMTEVRQDEAFKTRYVESRLAFAFERIVNENDTNRVFYFFIEQPKGSYTRFPSLVFTFDNEVRIDPQYSGDILARLFVDKDNQLCLVTWPLRLESPYEHMQKEVLLQDVEDINFELYASPSKDSKNLAVTTTTVDPAKTEPERDLWHRNEWHNTYKQMPSIVKITLDVKDEKSKGPVKVINFAFVLPSSKNPIFYPPSASSE